ncbi:MAG: MBL fold metallo-hydrolase [Acidiferrobacterales bacterium]
MKNILLLASLFLAALTFFIEAQAGVILPAPEKLSSRVYAWIGPYGPPNKKNMGFRMNMGFVVGNKAVAVIDSGYTPAMAHEMLDYIKSVTTVPVRYVINTNSQPHRFFGNTVFRKAGASILAHQTEVTRMKNSSAGFASGIERVLELKKDSVKLPALPDKIVTKEKRINLGGVIIHLVPMPANHTAGSLVVNVAEDKVIFAGDVLYGGRLLAITPISNTETWLQSFDSLKKYGNATFVPGHGKPGKLVKFKKPTRDYLQLLYSHMSKALDNGVGLQDAMESLDQKAFSDLENFKDLSGRNASWAYLEREKAFFD